jgi:hypothetical protein
MAPCTAAMPVAVTRQASAASSSARRFSSICTVGLPKREYWKRCSSPLKVASAWAALP